VQVSTHTDRDRQTQTEAKTHTRARTHTHTHTHKHTNTQTHKHTRARACACTHTTSQQKLSLRSAYRPLGLVGGSKTTLQRKGALGLGWGGCIAGRISGAAPLQHPPPGLRRSGAMGLRRAGAMGLRRAGAMGLRRVEVGEGAACRRAARG
jgi:hypothetical protein